jgi:hypothetical protein
MEILSDDERTWLKAALDAVRSGAGRSFPDERRTVEAVIWRQRNGAKWCSLSPEREPWRKAERLQSRWSWRGVWAAAVEDLPEACRPDQREVFLDGTSVRAHQDSGVHRLEPR